MTNYNERLEEILNDPEVIGKAAKGAIKAQRKMAGLESEEQYSDLEQLRSKLDRINLKLQEQLSESYFGGKEGRNNTAADTANYLTGFIIRVLELENE